MFFENSLSLKEKELAPRSCNPHSETENREM
jgi:hypothetical protein